MAWSGGRIDLVAFSGAPLQGWGFGFGATARWGYGFGHAVFGIRQMCNTTQLQLNLCLPLVWFALCFWQPPLLLVLAFLNNPSAFCHENKNNSPSHPQRLLVPFLRNCRVLRVAG